MRNKLLIVLFALILGLATPSLVAQSNSAAAQPDLAQTHPATVAQIHEYYATTHAIELAHKVMRQMMDTAQSTAAPYIPKSFWDDMRTTMDSVDLESAFIPAYQKYFSEEDMKQVLIFYKSEAGQHLLTAQPLITSAASEVLRKTGFELGRQVGERHADEIAAAKKKYDDEIVARQNSSQKQN
jgi:hypothetical protein